MRSIAFKLVLFLLLVSAALGQAPSITSLSPTAGPPSPVGSSLSITGTNFGSPQGTSTVTLGGIAVTPTSWTATKIVIPVPGNAAPGFDDVVVTVGGLASNAQSFLVIPVITSLSPTTGAIGTPVTVSGAGFGTSIGTSTVTFNGVNATPTSWSASSIVVPVPSGATTGSVVVTANGFGTNGASFTVPSPPPVINSISPTSGVLGTTVTIAGSNFGATQGSSQVVIGSNLGIATASSWSDTSITVSVPSSAVTGPLTVSVAGQASNSITFTVPPNITSLSPVSGPVGTALTINGSNFGAAQGRTNTVSLNGTALPVTSWSTTSIQTTIPSGASSGNVVVTVNSVASNSAPYSVTGFNISGVSPATGAPGTTVTISGVGFGASQGTSTVTFNGTTATPATWSDSSITVPVPAGAASGTGNVVVTVAGVASNGVSFTVNPNISGVSPTAAAASATVTITGGNFGATQGTSTVTIGGLPITPNSWSNGSIALAAPNLVAGNANVVVTVNGAVSNTAVLLIVPAITGTFGSTQVANSLTVSGTGFGSSQGTSTVTINGVAAPVNSWSSGSISVTVPGTATSGNVVVTVNGVASAGVPVTVSPIINSLTPVSGAVGTAVTINGTGFGATQGTSTVSFNGTAATPTSWSATQIVVPVPAGTTTGNVGVTIGGVASGGVLFTASPVISSLTPNSGPVGTSVTIAGLNFGAVQGTSTVTFNGITATPTNWIATQIIVPVPSGASNGNVVVTVGGLSSTGVSFTVAPVISGISPTAGPVGTSVTVTGVNFGATQGTSAVTFNGTAATPSSWNNTQIVVPVPSGSTTGNVVVTVGGLSSNGLPFAVAPSITSLSPTVAPVGASITITGTTFGSTQGTSTVTFNGTAATPTSWGATQIVVPVPGGATTGNVVVTVGGLASNGVSFAVAPSISSLSPNSGPLGTSVTISGTSFGATQGTSTVTFNGTAATPSSWSNTQIAVPVPSGASTGNVVVTVGGNPSAGVPFTVAPAISSLTPNSGATGSTIVIAGGSFGAASGGVTFNGLAATVSNWNANSITAVVPSGATTGNVVVTSAAGVASSGVSFRVVPPPSITGLSPASAPVGTTVTITGTNFGATQGNGIVTFNGVTATVTSWSDTQIVAPVPAGGATGNVVVQAAGGVASPGVHFVIPPPPPVVNNVNPVSGQLGAQVTINGSSFGITPGSVTFNGVAANTLTTLWGPISISLFVPDAATTGPVVVTTAGGPSNTNVTFTVLPPTITGILPSPAPVGTAVTISGQGFGGTQGALGHVTFTGVNGPINVQQVSSWTGNSITVTVPSGANTGVVTVTNSAGVSNQVNLIVPPSITGIQPASAAVGDSITISGEAFGTVQGTVNFGNTVAGPATNWSNNSIVIPVPNGLAAGTLNVTVTVNGQVSQPQQFGVAPIVRGLSLHTGPPEMGFVVNGANFGAQQAAGSTVTMGGVGGVQLNVIAWSDVSITVQIPANAPSVTANVVVTVGNVASEIPAGSNANFLIDPKNGCGLPQ